VTSLLRSLSSRSNPAISLSDAIGQLNYLGLNYGLTGGTLSGNEERIDGTFPGYVQGAYKRNGIVFACMAARMLMFSEARFKFRQQRAGRPGDLFGTPALGILEVPWTNGTTGGLLSRMIQDVDLAGNFYAARRPGPSLRRMQPDRVTIILGSKSGRDVDTDVLGYTYAPNPYDNSQKGETYLAEEVVHFAPYPDPEARFRGMSWLTPVLREVMADSAATTHKLKYFENGATPNLVVSLGEQARMTPQVFEEWVAKFEGQHEGVMNAYKTLYLAAGASANVVGSDMKQVDFKVTQGAGETRIAAAAGIPSSVVGLSEGLQGSSLNAGNFTAAIAPLRGHDAPPAVARGVRVARPDRRRPRGVGALVRRPRHLRAPAGPDRRRGDPADAGGHHQGAHPRRVRAGDGGRGRHGGRLRPAPAHRPRERPASGARQHPT
jgi:hypothetical protein